MILDSHALHNTLAQLCGHLAYGGAQAVQDVVILNGNYFSNLVDCGGNGLHIQRLDGVHIQYASGNAVLCQSLGSLDCQPNRVSVGNESNIPAILNLMSLANGKLYVLAVDLRNSVPGKAQEHGTVGIGRLAHQLSCGIVVRRHNHGHIGNGAQDTYILNGLMGGSVIGRSYTTVGAGNLHVQIGIADLLANHFAHT